MCVCVCVCSYTVSEAVAKEYNTPQTGALVRLVAPQPLVFPSGARTGVDIDGIMYNSRRVREQPHHLACKRQLPLMAYISM